MYYYITESPASREQQRALDEARELLTNLGISGEFVTASATRSVEELAELGVAKRYSTIVAVGSERLINQVGTLLAGTPYVFGALPLGDPAALELVSGVTTVREAAEALKHRLVKTTSIARIEPNKFFLTEIRLNSSQPLPIRITFDRAEASLDVTRLRLAGSGTLIATNDHAVGNRLSQWFGRLVGRQSNTDIYTSRFHANQFVIETARTQSVTLGNIVLAKTPLAVEILPNTLKMIVKRDRLPASSGDELSISSSRHGVQ